MITSELFESHVDLRRFCNKNNITKEKIIAINYIPDSVFHYVIIYEE